MKAEITSGVLHITAENETEVCVLEKWLEDQEKFDGRYITLVDEEDNSDLDK